MKNSFTRVFICVTLIFALASCTDDPTGSDDTDGPDNGDDEETPSNSAPTAVVSSSAETVTIGEEVTLDASESSDPDDDDLSYGWELTPPDGSATELSETEGESTTFTPDVAGDYVATLTVSDGNDNTDEDEVTVTAESDVVEISEDITESETWTSDNLYRVTDAINIESNAILTVEAGVTVEFEGSTGIKVDSDDAALNVQGTESDSVTFTGVQKDPGFWMGLGFESGHPSNKLEYAIVEYGGSQSWLHFNESANISIGSSSQLEISNSTIRHSSDFGLYSESGTDLSGFANNTFTGNDVPVRIPTTVMGVMDVESSYTGNSNDYVLVFEDDIEEVMTVSPLGVPYRISDIPDIVDGGEVTIAAGTVLEFRAAAGLDVASDNGALIIEGNAENPVILTGVHEEPGFWLGVHFDSTNPLNKIEHAIVEYGGNSTYLHMNEAGNITLRGGSRLEINNSTVRHSSDFGLFSESGTDLSGFSNNTLTGNDIPVGIPTTVMGVMDVESSYSGNTNDYILVKEEDVEDDMTISELEVPFRIENTPDIRDDAKVTVNAGVTMEFKANAGLSVRSDDAALIAEGEAENLVSFTGVQSQEGFWRGIRINSSNPLNEFKYTQINYGGSNEWLHFNESANISLRSGSQLTLTNSEIQFSGGYGVWAQSDVTITASNNYYTANADGDFNY